MDALTTGEFHQQATINSLGYRSPEFSLKKPVGTKRILVLGDSFTFGHGVGDRQIYPFIAGELLKQKGYKNAEVINAGYASGFSPDSYYLYLKERGMKLKPDVVVVGFFVFNDIADLVETVWDNVDENGLPVKISSCCRTVDDHRLHYKESQLRYKFPILRDSHLFILLVTTLQNRFHLFGDTLYISKHNPPPGCAFSPQCIEEVKIEEEKVHIVLKGMKQLTDKQGIPLVVVLIPIDFQLYPQMRWKYPFNNFPPPDNINFIQKRLGAFFKEQHILFLDLYPILDSRRAMGNPYYPVDGHFNPLGHQIAAQAIADYISEQKLIH